MLERVSGQPLCLLLKKEGSRLKTLGYGLVGSVSATTILLKFQAVAEGRMWWVSLESVSGIQWCSFPN